MSPQHDTQPTPPLLTALLEYADIATWYWHVDEDRFECSPNCRRHLALPEGALPRIEHLFSALHPDDKQGFEQQITALIENKIAHFQQDIRLLQPYGTIRWSSAYVIREMHDQALIVAGLLNDITKHKQQDIDLRNDLALFKNIYDRAMIGIAITDNKGNIEQCNAEFTKMMGYSETELQGMHFSTLIHPEDLEDNIAHVHRMQLGETDSFSIKSRYRRKDGHTLWSEKRISILQDESGVPQRMLALTIDVSAREAMQDELNESRHLFELALIGSELAIWDVDIKTEETHHDARYLAMLVLSQS